MRTNTTLDVLLECRSDDDQKVDGDREPAEPWTGFSQFTVLNEKPPGGYTWSGERLTKITQHQGPIIYGQRLGQVCRRLINIKKTALG